MKVLLVKAYGDYDAMDFENNHKPTKELWDSIKDGKKIRHSEEDYDLDIEALEFGDVDEEFISFLQEHVIDYESSKHTNFFVVK